ncbi:MAG: hypothetical protein GY923_15300 [Aestuariibacter sp.]|nr:hypothetical protein [Aestuariibacter sp.]
MREVINLLIDLKKRKCQDCGGVGLKSIPTADGFFSPCKCLPCDGTGLDPDMGNKKQIEIMKNSDRMSAMREQAPEMYALYDLDEPWPMQSVLRTLASGIDHLLDDHSCDAHAHEQLNLCRHKARTLADRIDAIVKAVEGEDD